MTGSERQTKVKLIAEAAVAAEAATGCPAEVSAAQCALESGWLQHSPGNNCFGIKDTDRRAGAQYVYTKEYINGSYKTLKLAFEIYDSLADCFIDHALLITGGFTPAERNCYHAHFDMYQRDGNLEDFIAGISAHYATAKAYAQSIKTLARQTDIVEAIAEARRAHAL